MENVKSFSDFITESEIKIFDQVGEPLSQIIDSIDVLLKSADKIEDQKWVAALKNIQTLCNKLESAIAQADTKLGVINMNEAKKSITQLATELVEIAAYYVEIDMTPEMNKAQSIEDEDELIEFYEELIDTVAEDAAGPDITKFKKEAVAFLKKYGVKIKSL